MTPDNTALHLKELLTQVDAIKAENERLTREVSDLKSFCKGIATNINAMMTEYPNTAKTED